jgi:hypothetical protein
MPRTARNFWLSADVDGRQSPVRGGPWARDGGITLRLYQRSDGEVRIALRVYCLASSNGTLRLDVEPALLWSFEKDGKLRIETKC